MFEFSLLSENNIFLKIITLRAQVNKIIESLLCSAINFSTFFK